MSEIDQKAVQAAEDPQLLEGFVRRNESFILKCASSVVRHYVTKSDDEWSIALSAFSQAVTDYSAGKGSFMSFAELVIRRKLIDYIRSQAKHRAEILVSPSVFDSSPEEDGEDNAMKAAVSEKIISMPDDSIQLEIEAANQAFSAYDFSFFDLAGCSPKAEKTKIACAKAVAYIIQNPIILHNVRKDKFLPVKLIEENTGVPRKVLERHRKYIIAAMEIMTGDYPCLSDYMRYIREELEK